MPFWKEADRMKAEGYDNDDIRNFALLAIADQIKAANEIAALQILVDRGELQPRRPTDGDLIRTRNHLYRVLNWEIETDADDGH